MTSALTHVAIDARMIRHSGIGTAIRGLLHGWRETPPPFDLTLMGDPGKLPEERNGQRHAQYTQGPYSLGAALLPAPVGSAQVVLAPHYAAPLWPRVPLVAIIHDLIHITHPTRRGTPAYMKAWLAVLRRRAAYIVTPSRHTKVQLQTLHGFAAHRVLTLPWGPGLAGMAEAREPAGGVLPGEPYLLSVGIDKPHKNWRFLIERLAGLWKSGALELPLAVAGMDAPGRERLKAIARRAGAADDRLRFLPWMDDGAMLAAYAGARALLFPSAIEGFGFPVIEAMAMGTPVVAADLPPMNEVGAGALALFDPDRPASFDEAVLHILGDDSLRASLRAAGQRRAAEHAWPKLASRMADVLARAAAERPD
ncbi:MAG: hypothetical protein PWP23_1623 [Candidatus Sumerlaeota bacterium]|nr:hypothetical protein [Candidatus Sumerlaeota bacterium]